MRTPNVGGHVPLPIDDREASHTLFTLGHSNVALDDFVKLLKAVGIEVVADVRSRPYSRFTPHFNREQLKRALKREGIGYVFMGDELGGRPSDPRYYDQDRHVRYDMLADSPGFRSAMDRLVQGARDYRVAVLCGEEDPTSCHRRRLVGQVAMRSGVEMLHIRGDGSVESELDVERREATQFPARFQLPLIDSRPWRSVHPVSPDQEA